MAVRKPDLMKAYKKKTTKPPMKHGAGKIGKNHQGGYTSKEYNLTKKEC